MKRVIVVLFLAMVVVGFVSAQNAATEHPIVGTWTCINGATWVFNANGTFTGYFFGVPIGGRFTSTQIAFVHVNRWGLPDTLVRNISVSFDGRTMILSRQDLPYGILLIKN